MTKKIVIIGGSAAGPKAASKARRLDQSAEITMIQKGRFLSMASCGYPYYVGGVFDKQSQMVKEPASFQNIKDINALVNTEVTSIDRSSKIVHAKNLVTREDLQFPYDKLMIATGSTPVIPPIPGTDLDGVTTLQSVEDAKFLKEKVQSKNVKHAVVVGGGLIGIETTEALQLAGIKVTIVERLPQILTFMDWEMARLVENHIREKGSEVLTKTSAQAIVGENGKVKGVKLDNGEELPCELVVLSVGVKPNAKLAQSAGLEIGEIGGLRVNKYLQTNDPDVYAAGDCIEPVNMINGEYTWLPMGDAANLQARVAAQNMVKDNPEVEYKGVVMTAICQAFDFTVGNTGFSENYARRKGYPNVLTTMQVGPDKPGFMGANYITIKMVADAKTGKFLGMQAIGVGDVAKRLAIGAMALHAGMYIEDLVSLDLPYAPPYSPAIDNFITAAHVLENKFLGRMRGVSATEVMEKVNRGDDMMLLDVRNMDEYEDTRLGLGEMIIPLPTLRRSLDNLPHDKEKEIIVYCKVSLRGYEAATFLMSHGFKNIKVMEGGMLAWPFTKAR